MLFRKENNMKKLFTTILAAGLISNASASMLTLVDCQFKFLGPTVGSKYVGLYKSFSGNYYEMVFDSYCPYTVNL
jgi:hypothetical protein